MYKQCRTEQSAQRQRELEQGLLRAMQKRHYDEISVSDLCQEMGIPRKAFYRYFSGKDGALHSLIDHALMDFDISSMAEKQTAQTFMAQVFSYWTQRKPLLDSLERSGLSGVLIQRAINYSQHAENLPLFLGSTEKQTRDYATMFAVCGLMTIIVQWHHDGFPQSIERMAELAMRLVSEPLFVDAKK